jgi:hypothetical protein
MMVRLMMVRLNVLKVVCIINQEGKMADSSQKNVKSFWKKHNFANAQQVGV